MCAAGGVWGVCGVRSQQKSWPVCGALPRTVPQRGAQLQGTLRSPPRPRRAAVPFTEPAAAGSHPEPPSSPGAVGDKRTRGGRAASCRSRRSNRRRPGAGRCRRGSRCLRGRGGNAAGNAAARPGWGSPRLPLTCPPLPPLPGRASAAKTQNFPRKTLGPGGLGRGPRLNGTLPRCGAGRSPGGAGKERVCSAGCPAAAVPAKPESLHVPASERPWDEALC